MYKWEVCEHTQRWAGEGQKKWEEGNPGKRAKGTEEMAAVAEMISQQQEQIVIFQPFKIAQGNEILEY